MSSSALSSSRPGLRGVPVAPSSAAPGSTGATNRTAFDDALVSAGPLDAGACTSGSADAASVTVFDDARLRRAGGAVAGAGSTTGSAAGAGAAPADSAAAPAAA